MQHRTDTLVEVFCAFSPWKQGQDKWTRGQGHPLVYTTPSSSPSVSSYSHHPSSHFTFIPSLFRDTPLPLSLLTTTVPPSGRVKREQGTKTMADVAFDLLGDASIHSTPSRDTNNNLLAHNSTGTALKEEEDAFSAAVSVWRGIFFIKCPTMFTRETN